MTQRLVLYGLLAVVAAAAAVLSFAALRDLALLCGFSSELAWLLPVAIDAGAAAGSLVWLGRQAPEGARAYARTLALTLLVTSVAANALSHGLAAGRVIPVWWVVVLVSAIAPSILGAVIHLGVLVGRGEPPQPERDYELDAALEWADRHAWRQRHGLPGDALQPVSHSSTTPPGEVGDLPGEPVESWEAKRDRLLQARAGRTRLMNELGITEHAARKLLEARATDVESGGEELA